MIMDSCSRAIGAETVPEPVSTPSPPHNIAFAGDIAVDSLHRHSLQIHTNRLYCGLSGSRDDRQAPDRQYKNNFPAYPYSDFGRDALVNQVVYDKPQNLPFQSKSAQNEPHLPPQTALLAAAVQLHHQTAPGQCFGWVFRCTKARWYALTWSAVAGIHFFRF